MMPRGSNPEGKAGVLDPGYATARANSPVLRFRLMTRAVLVAAAVREHLPAGGHTLLDLGCAEGATLSVLAGLLPETTFTGVEYATPLLAAAPSLPASVRLLPGDATALPATIEPGYYDVVSALALLEHVPHPERVVKEAVRVLKPNGLFIATSPSPFWDRTAVRLSLLKGGQHVTDMDKHALTALARNAGLEVVDFRRFMFAPLAFLPYLGLRLPADSALGIDRLLAALRIFDWAFVNQSLVARKPSPQ